MTPSLKQAIKYIPGSRPLYQYAKRVLGITSPSGRSAPVTILNRGRRPRPDLEKLQAEYQKSPLYSEPDTFVLYRIIGNDLVPRHRRGQSRENLKFILKNEPSFPDCEKRFIINRITKPHEEKAIISMLKDAGYAFTRIPFDPGEYKTIPWDIHGVPHEYVPYTKRFASLAPAEQNRLLMRLYRHKNNYVMNNNGARNTALKEGRKLAKWVLPFDGNCFITQKAWQNIAESVKSKPYIPYFTVPMTRVTDNSRLLDPQFSPEPAEEPQVLFRRNATLWFNEEFFYGRRPKVEILWRLGVPGKWDEWFFEPWDLPAPEYSDQAGCYSRAGWVARLNSGQIQLEANTQQVLIDRGLARNQAISSFLDQLDSELLYRADTGSPLILNQTHLPEELSAPAKEKLLDSLYEAANQALGRGPYSVTNKTTLAPSGDPHDYFHPAPYYWPNPLKPSGRPYVYKDGRRVPGTRLYEPESDKYDRTRLQRLLDDTLVLALAWDHFGEPRFAEHAAFLVRTWFLEPETAMNPSLNYAQVCPGHNNDLGSNYGIIEMKDLYYFLDAVRLLQNSGTLSSDEHSRLRQWLSRYLDWLLTSPQGQKERASANNHGVYYDLQVASVAAFLGETLVLRDTLRDSRFRILQHFNADGTQPAEMKRTMTAHYCCFNLQGWIHLCLLGQSAGEDLWNFTGKDGRGIKAAMYWLLSHLGEKWPYKQIEDFDYERFYPIYYACLAKYGLPSQLADKTGLVPHPGDIKPLFYPHDGIRPFWQITAAKNKNR
ncbi:MAG: alginate lyase family protein [Desulfosalsimonas sp.]